MARHFNLGGLELNQSPYLVISSNIDDLTPHKAITRQLATSNRARTVRIDLLPKKIKIRMLINASDSDAAETALDRLKQVINRRSATLMVDFVGGRRVWQVHISRRGLPTRRRGTDISRIPFDLNLTADDGIGRGLTQQDLFEAITGQTTEFEREVNYSGNELLLPIIQITYTAIAPTDRQIEVRLSNTSLTTPMIISRTIAPGSILEIDCEKEIVRLGTTIIRAKNDFLSFAEAGEVFRYSDNADSRTIDITAVYHPRYG